MRIAFLSLCLFISLSSASLLRKSIARRQADAENCQAIEGFDCKCSYYRVTCTTERELQSTLTIVPQEKEKYSSVELVITGQRDYNIQDSTFLPIKQLYKPDADNVEFRVKFEKFTALNLQSPGIFNRVFPDGLPSNARKYLALEIYNPEVQPHENPALFQNLNADSLELYTLYPFRGSFQELFDGANIKYLRLSGGDTKSDLSKPFSGNIGRLELAKQASSLSIQNFPVYPVHELIINAYYVSEFNTEHPPNYSNLAELRIHSPEFVPANAFQQFPNIRVLSVSSEQGIDPQAFNGLNNLEKLTVKDTQPSIEILSAIPSIKEYEVQIEKLDETSQCQLIEKLANGQVAIQAIQNGPHCSCVSSYLDTVSGRYPCDAANCEQSTCAVIRNNYDASTRTFKQPPTIHRADGTNALRQRDSRVYNTPYQIPAQDQEKLAHAMPHHSSSGSSHDGGHQQSGHQDHPSDADASQGDDQDSAGPHDHQSQHHGHDSSHDKHDNDQQNQPESNTGANDDGDDQNDQGGVSNDQDNEGNASDNGSKDENANTDGEGSNDQSKGHGEATSENNDGSSTAAGGDGSTDEQTPTKKKGINWLFIVLISAAILGIIVTVVICIIVRNRKNRGYNPTATSDQNAPSKS